MRSSSPSSSPRAPPRSVTSDDDGGVGDVPAGAKRRHSFSTDCSARTVVVVAEAVGDADDDAIAVARARAREETRPDADGCVRKISMTALRALAETRRDVARPDGADLHADVCATLLRREGAIGRDAMMMTKTTGGAEDGAAWHHAPYRGQLVEWILDVCAGERYGPTTADVAIAYTVRGGRNELEGRAGV